MDKLMGCWKECDVVSVEETPKDKNNHLGTKK